MHSPGSSSGSTCSACNAVVHEGVAAGLCTHCLNSRLGIFLGENSVPNTTGLEPLPPGFEYVEELGRGGMGVVYLVYQRSLERYVALKQLGPAWRNHAKARERFVQEARAAARLVHPRIVPVLEVGTHGDCAWYTMEYLEGGDLSQSLADSHSMPWRKAVELVATVCDAIEFAHAAGVVHRDLKPSNILLGADGTPKVTDFGLAWMTGQELKDLTATGEILGTPAYMAPEWVSGRQRDTEAKAADIYSLGALLYHTLAGRPPFVREHPLQLLAVIASETAPRLDLTPDGKKVPWHVADVCARCLEKKPAHRYSTAGDLAIALRRCLDGGSVVARVRSYLGQHTRSMAVISAVAVLTLLVFASLSYPDFPSWKFPNSKSAASPQSRYKLIAVLPLKGATNDESTQLLASGLQDEVITSITRLTDLKVIGSGSARTADKQTQDPRQLRTMLGADAVLSASVQKWQDMLRIAAQLLDTRDGTVLWSQTYDRRETNLLNLQTDIATDVALRLRGTLSRDAASLARESEADGEAQKLALKARALWTNASASIDQLNEAESLLNRAVQIDPNYALAFAQLSQLHTLKYHWGNDRTSTRLGLGLSAAQAALRLDPELPDAALAMGNFYLRGSRDYATAKPYFDRVLQRSPHNPGALEGLANLLRREGHFEASAENYESALELDPLNPILAYNTADTFLRLRNYAKANEILELALGRMVGHVALVKLRGDLMLAWKGDLSAMREDLQTRDPRQPNPPAYLLHKIDWFVYEDRIPDALSTLESSEFKELDGQAIYLTRESYLALLNHWLGRKERARASAAAALPEITGLLKKSPNDPRLLLLAGQMYAAEGDLPRANKTVARLFDPRDNAAVDAFDRGVFLYSVAIMRAAAGDAEGALADLRIVLGEPNQISKAMIKLHPVLRKLSEAL